MRLSVLEAVSALVREYEPLPTDNSSGYSALSPDRWSGMLSPKPLSFALIPKP